jgi:hypothetical protein
MPVKPSHEVREAAVSLRAVMEIDVEALAHRRRNRHRSKQEERLARKGLQQLAAASLATGDDGAAAPSTALATALPAEIRAALGCRYPMTLALDFEFETTTRQAPRVGFYCRRGVQPAEIVARIQAGTFDRALLNRPCELGFIYDGQVITPRERLVIENEVRRLRRALGMVDMGYVRVCCYSIEQFVRFVWRKWAQRAEYGCAVIGHNLPVDLARLLDPRDVRAGVRDFTGGFSCGLRWNVQEETYRNRKGELVRTLPPRRLQFRHVGLHKDFIHLARRFPGDATGQFLDTARAVQALFGPGDYRLGALARQLKLPRKRWKLAAPDYNALITPAFLRYLRRDVWSAEAVYRALAEAYSRWELDGNLHTLFSVASLGKRLLAKIGIPRAAERQNELTYEERGHFISTYSGGRVESNCRLQIVRGQYRDFRSLYPLVNAIQDLQRFLLAERVTSLDALAWVCGLLASHSPAQLKRSCLEKAHWRALQVIVKFRPNGKLPLPTRADYSHSGNTAAHNMGDNFLRVPEGLPEVWFTLADLIAGVMRSPFLDPDRPVLEQANMPPVLAARELVPEGRITTRPVDLFDYRVDLNAPGVDLFARLIDLRGQVQAEIKKLKRERPAGWEREVEYLDGVQQAFKLVSNATSYGILLEFLLDPPLAEKPWARVHSLRTYEGTVEQLEQPGEYALPEVGTFITGGARLMVALAEDLCAERGLRFAYVDTDGMFAAQPGWVGDKPGLDAVDDATFRAQVDGVANELQPLNPFAENKPIWKLEDENYAPDLDTLDAVTGQFEPLYGAFICDKRGALFNLLDGPDGTKAVRIRKFSGHGLGLWGGRRDYRTPDPATRPACPIPDPWTRGEEEPDPYKLKGGARWVYDLWHDFLWTLANGHYPSGAPLEWALGQPLYTPDPRDNPAWNRPVYYQQTLATWELFEQYGAVEARLPYNFVTAAPSPVAAADVFALDLLHGQMQQHERLMAARPELLRERDRADSLSGFWKMVPDDWQSEPPEVWQRWLPTDTRYRDVTGHAVYTAYCDSDAAFERAWAEGRVLVRGQGWSDERGQRHGPAEDSQANQLVPAYLRPRSLGSILARHFQHPEMKRAGGKRAGWNDRLEVVATRFHAIGKESDLLAEDIAEELDNIVPGEHPIGGSQELGVVQATKLPEPEPEAPTAERVRAILARHGIAALVSPELSRQLLSDIRAHPGRPRSVATWQALLDQASALDAQQALEQDARDKVAASVARELAREEGS